jgi:hypothetical protein
LTRRSSTPQQVPDAPPTCCPVLISSFCSALPRDPKSLIIIIFHR